MADDKGLVAWAKEGQKKPGGFWNNLPDDDPGRLDYDIYDDSVATDEERLFALRLIWTVYDDRNDYYDLVAKAVAAALAAERVGTRPRID